MTALSIPQYLKLLLPLACVFIGAFLGYIFATIQKINDKKHEIYSATYKELVQLAREIDTFDKRYQNDAIHQGIHEQLCCFDKKLFDKIDIFVLENTLYYSKNILSKILYCLCYMKYFCENKGYRYNNRTVLLPEEKIKVEKRLTEIKASYITPFLTFENHNEVKELMQNELTIKSVFLSFLPNLVKKIKTPKITDYCIRISDILGTYYKETENINFFTIVPNPPDLKVYNLNFDAKANNEYFLNSVRNKLVAMFECDVKISEEFKSIDMNERENIVQYKFELITKKPPTN